MDKLEMPKIFTEKPEGYKARTVLRVDGTMKFHPDGSWVSVKDELPKTEEKPIEIWDWLKESEVVLFYEKDSNYQFTGKYVEYYQKDNNEYCFRGIERENGARQQLDERNKGNYFWMTLPEAPKE